MEVVTVKLLVAGPFAAGKSTLISAISEIPVVATEAEVTDETCATKLNTTVTMDYGKLTVADEELRAELLMFGTPGQDRFLFLWDDLVRGAIGAVVLVDTRRIEDSFEVFDQLETRTGMPFAVAVNEFPDAPKYTIEQLREALDLLPDTPIVQCDARHKESSAHALITLVEHALHHPASQKALT